MPSPLDNLTHFELDEYRHPVRSIPPATAARWHRRWEADGIDPRYFDVIDDAARFFVGQLEASEPGNSMNFPPQRFFDMIEAWNRHGGVIDHEAIYDVRYDPPPSVAKRARRRLLSMARFVVRSSSRTPEYAERADRKASVLPGERFPFELNLAASMAAASEDGPVKVLDIGYGRGRITNSMLREYVYYHGRYGRPLRVVAFDYSSVGMQKAIEELVADGWTPNAPIDFRDHPDEGYIAGSLARMFYHDGKPIPVEVRFVHGSQLHGTTATQTLLTKAAQDDPERSTPPLYADYDAVVSFFDVIAFMPRDEQLPFALMMQDLLAPHGHSLFTVSTDGDLQLSRDIAGRYLTWMETLSSAEREAIHRALPGSKLIRQYGDLVYSTEQGQVAFLSLPSAERIEALKEALGGEIWLARDIDEEFKLDPKDKQEKRPPIERMWDNYARAFAKAMIRHVKRDTTVRERALADLHSVAIFAKASAHLRRVKLGPLERSSFDHALVPVAPDGPPVTDVSTYVLSLNGSLKTALNLTQDSAHKGPVTVLVFGDAPIDEAELESLSSDVEVVRVSMDPLETFGVELWNHPCRDRGSSAPLHIAAHAIAHSRGDQRIILLSEDLGENVDQAARSLRVGLDTRNAAVSPTVGGASRTPLHAALGVAFGERVLPSVSDAIAVDTRTVRAFEPGSLGLRTAIAHRDVARAATTMRDPSIPLDFDTVRTREQHASLVIEFGMQRDGDVQSAAHWQSVLGDMDFTMQMARRTLVQQRDAGRVSSDVAGGALEVVNAARQQHATITAEQCIDYVRLLEAFEQRTTARIESGAVARSLKIETERPGSFRPYDVQQLLDATPAGRLPASRASLTVRPAEPPPPLSVSSDRKILLPASREIAFDPGRLVTRLDETTMRPPETPPIVMAIMNPPNGHLNLADGEVAARITELMQESGLTHIVTARNTTVRGELPGLTVVQPSIASDDLFQFLQFSSGLGSRYLIEREHYFLMTAGLAYASTQPAHGVVFLDPHTGDVTLDDVARIYANIPRGGYASLDSERWLDRSFDMFGAATIGDEVRPFLGGFGAVGVSTDEIRPYFMGPDSDWLSPMVNLLTEGRPIVFVPSGDPIKRATSARLDGPLSKQDFAMATRSAHSGLPHSVAVNLWIDRNYERISESLAETRRRNQRLATTPLDHDRPLALNQQIVRIGKIAETVLDRVPVEWYLESKRDVMNIIRHWPDSRRLPQMFAFAVRTFGQAVNRQRIDAMAPAPVLLDAAKPSASLPMIDAALHVSPAELTTMHVTELLQHVLGIRDSAHPNWSAYTPQTRTRHDGVNPAMLIRVFERAMERVIDQSVKSMPASHSPRNERRLESIVGRVPEPDRARVMQALQAVVHAEEAFDTLSRDLGRIADGVARRVQPDTVDPIPLIDFIGISNDPELNKHFPQLIARANPNALVHKAAQAQQAYELMTETVGKTRNRNVIPLLRLLGPAIVEATDTDVLDDLLRQFTATLYGKPAKPPREPASIGAGRYAVDHGGGQDPLAKRTVTLAA